MNADQKIAVALYGVIIILLCVAFPSAKLWALVIAPVMWGLAVLAHENQVAMFRMTDFEDPALKDFIRDHALAFVFPGLFFVGGTAGLLWSFC